MNNIRSEDEWRNRRYEQNKQFGEPGLSGFVSPVADAPGSLQKSRVSSGLNFPLQALLMEIVRHLVLVFEQPIDAGFALHGFAYNFGGRLAMDVE